MLLKNTWFNQSPYISPGLLKIKFARVYLKLSVNEKLVAHGIVVKILVTLMSPCLRGCHLIQKLEPVTERVFS